MTMKIPKTMQAVRLHGPSFDAIRVEEVPVPTPNGDQLLVQVDAAGVCSSNLKIIAQGKEHALLGGWDPSEHPITLGDEGCVTVVATGNRVAARYPVGQRYATQPAVDHPPINHRECYRNNAEGMQKVAVGYTLPGHLAEYMLVTEETLAAECLLPVASDEVPFFSGALCEPLSCVISAQDRHVHFSQQSPAASRIPALGIREGGIVVVIGAGPMGRLHAEAALRFRPRHLLVVDVADQRLDWARRVLVPRCAQSETQIHAVTADRCKEVLTRLSDGHGADDVIVAVGIREVQNDAQQLLGKGGVLNLFGGLKKGKHLLDLDSIRVHYQETKIVGSSGGSPADVAEALRMCAAGELDPGQHLAMVGSLDQFPQALQLVKEQLVDGRIVLYPQICTTPLVEVESWDRTAERDFLQAHQP